MGSRGPQPKNPALKVLSGKAPITAISIEEINEPFIPPEIPSHLNDREIIVWNNSIKLLQYCKILKKTDTAVLGAYCSAFVRWQDAEREIQSATSIKAGLCTLSKGGKVKGVNPLVVISRDAQRDMVFYAAQLGMTPAARMKMITGASKVVEKNPFMVIKAMKK